MSHSDDAPIKATGAYQLLLRLRRDVVLRVEPQVVGYKFDGMTFPKGYCLYTGSAMGSGGIDGRLRSHFNTGYRRQWHVDHLTGHADVEIAGVIRWPSDDRQECEIGLATERLPGAGVPARGFGNADKGRNKGRCRCTSHLIHFQEVPSGAWIAPGTGASRR